MTLGPALIAMSWLDRLHFAFTNPLSVFGRVPFFYYAAHLLLAHAIAIVLNFARYGQTPFLWVAPPSMGGPTGCSLLITVFRFGWSMRCWIVVLLPLYPACLWFARLKLRRHDGWLSDL